MEVSVTKGKTLTTGLPLDAVCELTGSVTVDTGLVTDATVEVVDTVLTVIVGPLTTVKTVYVKCH